MSTRKILSILFICLSTIGQSQDFTGYSVLDPHDRIQGIVFVNDIVAIVRLSEWDGSRYNYHVFEGFYVSADSDGYMLYESDKGEKTKVLINDRDVSVRIGSDGTALSFRKKDFELVGGVINFMEVSKKYVSTYSENKISFRPLARRYELINKKSDFSLSAGQWTLTSREINGVQERVSNTYLSSITGTWSESNPSIVYRTYTASFGEFLLFENAEPWEVLEYQSEKNFVVKYTMNEKEYVDSYSWISNSKNNEFVGKWINEDLKVTLIINENYTFSLARWEWSKKANGQVYNGVFGKMENNLSERKGCYTLKGNQITFFYEGGNLTTKLKSASYNTVILDQSGSMVDRSYTRLKLTKDSE